MSAQAMNKRRTLAGKRERRQVLIGMAYIAPSFILMMIFNVIPIFVSLFLAFCKYNMVGTPTWIGLENFQKLFANKALREAMINTLRYVLMTVPVQTILALLVAAFIADRLQNRYGSFLRSVIFIPVIISLIASATVWSAAPVNFLGGKKTALASVAAVAVWKNTGYYMVIYYAGIMNVSTEVREAAIVDGANAAQRFWYITMPILKPITYMIVTLGIIGSFQVFDLVYKMTGGGPGRSTYTVAYMIYTYAFQDKRIGYACALAIVLLVIILVIHAVQTLLFKEKETA